MKGIFQILCMASGVAVFSAFIASCGSGNKTIPIEAAIVYSYGGAQPVARTEFYLLRKDFLELGKEIGFLPVIDPLDAEARGKSGNPARAGVQVERIKDYIVMKATTDFSGKAQFENVPSGVYYIVGYAETRKQDSLYDSYRIWNVRVDTANYDGKPILLDQKSALDNRRRFENP